MLKKYLVAGLLVWVPLGITVLVVKFLVDLMDRTLLLLPPEWRPEYVFGFTIPGFGFILVLAVVLFTGAIVANLLGRKLLALGEAIVDRIPLVRTVYSSAKQILASILSTGSHSFRKVLLIEYPRRGIWTLCFQTAKAPSSIQEEFDEDALTVFVPTTPNPTSGFIIVVPKSATKELDMDIESALKLIMSLGIANSSSAEPVDSGTPNP